MRKRVKIALLLVLLALAGAWLEMHLREPIHGGSSAVAMTFVGYTNPPVGQVRFALFSVSNEAPYTVTSHGNWVELEGNPDHWARVVNPNLPGYRLPRVLNVKQTVVLAVGEPTGASETQRWRFSMLFSRYTWRERWLHFLVAHKLPMRLGRVELVDVQRIVSPSNSVTLTTEWLAK